MMAERTVRSFDGVCLCARREGVAGGPSVLLSHYLGGSLEGWDAVVARLSDRFDIVRYDTRGHGASDAPAGPYSVDMLGRDALAVLQAFDIEKAHFVGVSQGGMSGMWLAAHHPARVHRLVLANTTPFIPNKQIWDELIEHARREGLADIAASTIAGWVCDAFRQGHPQIVESLVSVMAGMPVEGYAGACAVLRDVDLRGDLASIRSPTLVIAGAEDGPRGAGAPAMAAAIPDAILVTLPQAAHLSHVENPDAFAAAVEAHLA